jgi:hypothetical protein
MARLSHVSRKWFPFITVAIFAVSVSTGNVQDRAAWLKQARWGVMNHYLADWIAHNGHLRNPRLDKTVTLHRDGKKAENLSGSLLKLPMAAGETITVVAEGDKPSQKEIL